MSDEADPNAKSKAQLPILLGIVGAIGGYVGVFAVVIAAQPQDAVTALSSALFFIGPIGAVIGAFAGARLGTLIRPPKAPAVESPAAQAQTGAPVTRAAPPAAQSPAAPAQTSAPAMRSVPQASGGTQAAGSTGRNAFKALGITFGSAALLIGGYVFIDYHFFATPWLRPNGTELPFEVRLPAGSAMPPADSVKGLLRTTVNTMPAEMKPAAFRRDGDRPVIVGVVDLAFRSSSRQLEITIPGRAVASHPIKIATSPSHMKALGAWQTHPDGSEIRYRVKHPGKD